MKLSLFAGISILSVSFVVAQAEPGKLSPGTTLPIQFERSIDSSHVHAGDAVAAKTTQVVKLDNGEVLPAGARVTGHVLAARGFAFDKTPYARQSASTLTIHFDSIQAKGETLPLRVYVRAIADPFAVWDSERPQATDMDPLSTTTQIGGDLVVPSQKEVTSQDGDTVGYKRHGGVYAHLISATGNGPATCDASDTEQSMGHFSASACGLYGFTDVTMLDAGNGADSSTLTLSARRRSAKIWAKSEALLEVLGDNSKTISQ